MTDYPQWVRERACELANVKATVAHLWEPSHVGSTAYPHLLIIADLILKYETAPVDPAVEALQGALDGIPLTSAGDVPELLLDRIRAAGFDIVKVQP